MIRFNSIGFFDIVSNLFVPVAQWIERSPPKRQVARSIRAGDDPIFSANIDQYHEQWPNLRSKDRDHL